MYDTLTLVRELIELPGPPGQEEAVRDAVIRHVACLGCTYSVDARGNLLVAAPGVAAVPERAEVVVMAHLDEIALLVVRIEEDGWLRVANLGGLFPWKWGEGPVTILAPSGRLPGVLSFGSIHTNAQTPAIKARETALKWEDVRIFTGLSKSEMEAAGVRPGVRVALGEARRTVTELGGFLAAPFLDDRADLAAWIMALAQWKERNIRLDNVVFAATAAEEVGGHGAQYLLRRLQPEIGIALEIGPRVPENPFPLDAQPTVWTHDGYSTMQARDIDLVADAAASVDLAPHWQALSRGGSDASCAASFGLVARPITLAFAAENSHGYEIMHRDAVPNLAKLLLAVLDRISQSH